MNADVKICVFQIDTGCPVVWAKKRGNVFDAVHAEMRWREIQFVQSFQIDEEVIIVFCLSTKSCK